MEGGSEGVKWVWKGELCVNSWRDRKDNNLKTENKIKVEISGGGMAERCSNRLTKQSETL